MRITGGSARGQIIKTLPGLLVRPTTDKVREAIFSMLASRLSDWSTGLDLYAGSGALGIEALSRGADWVDFVDQNDRVCRTIKENLKTTGFSDNSKVYCSTVLKAIGFLEKKYSFVFLDPPYKDLSLGSVLETIAQSELITDDSIIVASHSSRSDLEDKYLSLSKIKEKNYGDTCISMYEKEVAS
jgi:16S rRNA (guanine966-N2)-methyltransferase